MTSFERPTMIQISVFVEFAQGHPFSASDPAKRLRSLRIIIVITEHHILTARQNFADTVFVGRVNFDFHARKRFADAAAQQFIFRARHGQNRRRFGQTITFQNRKTESVQIALNFFSLTPNRPKSDSAFARPFPDESGKR